MADPPRELSPSDPGVWDLLRATAFALFLDVDGTLLDFADRPELVEVSDGLVVALARVERMVGGALALVSGREIEELDRLFTPLNLRASGVHGARMRFAPEATITTAPSVRELPVSLWERLTQALTAFPGAFAENKGFSFAVHYRRAPAAAAALRNMLRRLLATETWSGIEILDAHYAYELKAPSFDKGRAIASFMRIEPFVDRTPIFVGDDTTDEPGFAYVSDHGGLAFSVGSRRAGAIGTFRGPSEVRDWLGRLAARGTLE